MSNLKKLTLLHSNDLHGDFTAETVDDNLIGGVSMLSGYLNQVRSEEENVLYAVAGDMFRGSVIDSEFKGFSTIEIMNMLLPDVATMGNHEVDYGLAHLLFLEKCARFPIINANMYIKSNNVRLFQGHFIKEIGGMRVMFIGILTEDVLAATKKDSHIGTLIDIRDAAAEVGSICNAFQTEDIDLTILLTHIGINADRKLAALLRPEWGIDLIIGGHSHTLLREPVTVNGIPIVQAASGTDQIGRFDLTVNSDTHSIERYSWQLIPINDKHCRRDLAMEDVLHKYKTETDKKYNRYITKLAREYTNPRRDRETEIGKLIADVYRDSLGLDIMMLGSGSLRSKAMGPVVLYRDLHSMCPFEEEIYRIGITGAQLKHALEFIHRPEALEDEEHSEFYQYSSGLRFVYSVGQKKLLESSFHGEAIEDDRVYNVGMHSYHFKNTADFWDVTEEELKRNKLPRVVSTGSIAVLDEWMSSQKLMTVSDEPRWIMED